jgi:hypothetical protein
MADKKNTCYNCIHSGDNDNMNSAAHIHCKLFWELDSSRSEQPKEMKRNQKNGWYDFRITSTQYGWKKIASITQLNPSKI